MAIASPRRPATCLAAALALGLLPPSLASCGSAPTDAMRPALLSLDPAPLVGDERLDGFEIVTHGITALALCHKPHEWIISYGNSDGSGGGFLGGQAKSAAYGLDPSGLKELRRVFLVVPNGQPTGLEGVTRVRSRTSGDTRVIPLQPSNFKLDPAGSCG